MTGLRHEHSLTVLFIFLAFCGVLSCVQKSPVQPDREEISIGKITDNSNVFFSFYLMNDTDQEVKIEEITSSLSHVAVQRQVEVLPPRDSVKVEMVVVGNGMEGAFRAEVVVKIPGKRQPHPVYVSGVVEKTPLTVTERCRVPFGSLLIEQRDLKFGTIKTGKVYKDTLLVYNPTDESQSVRAVSRAGNAMARLIDPAVKPGKAAYLEVTLKVEDLKQLGKLYENMIFMIGRDVRATGLLTVEADVIENFDDLPENDLKEAPHLLVEQTKFNFGTVKAGTDVKHSFVLQNTGHRNLMIRKIQPSCGCTAAVPGQRVIAPEASTTLEVVFRTAGRNGRQQKSILLFTNDPACPELKLWLTGEVSRENE